MVTGIPFFKRYTCPHCGGHAGSCCRCNGRGYVTSVSALLAAVRSVLAQPRCACDACYRILHTSR